MALLMLSMFLFGTKENSFCSLTDSKAVLHDISKYKPTDHCFQTLEIYEMIETLLEKKQRLLSMDSKS